MLSESLRNCELYTVRKHGRIDLLPLKLNKRYSCPYAYIQHDAMMMYEGVEVYPNAFSTSVLDGVERSVRFSRRIQLYGVS
jgi:hypothetical protein